MVSMFFAVPAVILGLIAGYYIFFRRGFDEQAYRLKAERLLADAEDEAEKTVKTAQSQVDRLKDIIQREIIQFDLQIKKMEQALKVKDEIFNKRLARNVSIKNTADEEETLVKALRMKGEEIVDAMQKKLELRTGMSARTAKDKLIEMAEEETRKENERRTPKLEELFKENSVRDSKNILAETIYKYGAQTSVEKRAGELTVRKDSAKGVIVGRGGKNIACFEDLFQVDVVFNDAPNTISVSCFNLVHRETARIGLKKLMNEKIIDERKIKTVKEEADKEMEGVLRSEGEKAAKILGLNNLSDEFIRLMGRLRFRTSYGQNIMGHCLEVGYFAKIIAESIGADAKVAWLGGFFHDIGKAIDQEVGGSHDVLSKEILEKYQFPWEIVHAAWTHHDAIPQETVEAVIVKAADAISAGRPGARSLSLEQYIQKIKELEATASSFEGVKKAFAISAGREVRVIADPERMTDEGMSVLADGIAKKIEEKGGYPGKIKVTAIRTTRVSDIAKQKVLKIPSRPGKKG